MCRAVSPGVSCRTVSSSAVSSATKICTTSHSSATSTGDPTKYCSKRGVRFQTKTWSPRLRSAAATRDPIIPSPIKPTFLLLERAMFERRILQVAPRQGEIEWQKPQSRIAWDHCARRRRAPSLDWLRDNSSAAPRLWRRPRRRAFGSQATLQSRAAPLRR